MHGTICASGKVITFFSLFQGTYAKHGREFCYAYYVRKHGMELWEFNFWLARMSAV